MLLEAVRVCPCAAASIEMMMFMQFVFVGILVWRFRSFGGFGLR